MFANPEQFLLTTCGMLSQGHPEQGGELPPLAKGGSVSDRAMGCGRRRRSDTRDRYQPSASFVLARCLLDYRIGFVDSCFQMIKAPALVEPAARAMHPMAWHRRFPMFRATPYRGDTVPCGV
jgi:hypothetical protein